MPGMRFHFRDAVPLLCLVALALATALGLSGCRQDLVTPTKAVIPAQVAYRIDDHRYFEITPENDCFGDMLYFVDTAKGIRSEVVSFDIAANGTTLIIDAANEDYLVGPVTRGGLNCSSGGGGCGDKMPYSTDGGRTWKRVWSPGNSYDLMVSGSTAYQSHRIQTVVTDGLDLTLHAPASSDWRSVRQFNFIPRIAPVDRKVSCEKITGRRIELE